MKWIGFLLLSAIVFVIPNIVQADTMSNDNYTIEKGTTDDAIPTPTPEENKQVIVLKPQDFLTSGNARSFSVSLDSTSLSFDTLYPTDPVLRSATLSLHAPAEGSLLAFQREDHALTSAEAQILPDTTCDAGICSPYTSAVWTNILTYGFGFQCKLGSVFCDGKSDEDTYYRVANQSRHEFPAQVYKGDSQTQGDLSLTYKLNSSSTQPSGIYQNTIEYIIVPSY